MHLSVACLGGVVQSGFNREVEPVGPIYRKLRSLWVAGVGVQKFPVTEEDRQGWMLVPDHGATLMLRSRKTNEWITEESFRAEELAIRKESVGKKFSSRKGFRLAQEIPGLQAWEQIGIGKRRIPVVFGKAVGWVRIVPRRDHI